MHDTVEGILEEMHELGIPMDDDTARKLIKNFIARIRRLIKRRGGDPAQFKYIYVIETTREVPGPFAFIYLFFKFNFIFKLYITVLVLPNIKMNPP